eukprot:GFUD01023356.1.p1 GENE.GFUD01023356.1~~GFUD01023356.1.p1  ORF type:complete len:365 (+),score=99.04 GFUD01023356.1:98-1192(+)
MGQSSRMKHICAVLFLFISLVKMVMSGCRWSNPAWLQSLDSAPQVEITKDQLVNVEWSKSQFKDRFDCADKFDVGVEGGEVDVRPCSIERKIGFDNYSCRLDLSNPKHCGQVFSFWVSAVNLNHNRGVQTVNTFANTIIHIKCGEQSQTSQVLSTSCLAVFPAWLDGPFIRQTGEQQIRVEWDRSHLTNAHCVDNFLLKLWESSTFSPKYTTLTFPMTEGQDTFGGNLEVLPCKSYTYILSAVTKSGIAVDIQGELKIPCSGESFLKPLGEDFNDTNEIGLSEERFSSGRAIGKGDRDNTTHPEFTSFQRKVAKVQANPNSRQVKPPLLEALASSEKSSAGPRQHETMVPGFTLFLIILYIYFY